MTLIAPLRSLSRRGGERLVELGERVAVRHGRAQSNVAARAELERTLVLAAAVVAPDERERQLARQRASRLERLSVECLADEADRRARGRQPPSARSSIVGPPAVSKTTSASVGAMLAHRRGRRPSSIPSSSAISSGPSSRRRRGSPSLRVSLASCATASPIAPAPSTVTATPGETGHSGERVHGDRGAVEQRALVVADLGQGGRRGSRPVRGRARRSRPTARPRCARVVGRGRSRPARHSSQTPHEIIGCTATRSPERRRVRRPAPTARPRSRELVALRRAGIRRRRRAACRRGTRAGRRRRCRPPGHARPPRPAPAPDRAPSSSRKSRGP